MSETRLCYCGCGTEIARIDSLGVERFFKSGHNMRSYHHPRWKGHTPGAHAVHNWMLKHHPKTGVCEICGDTPKRKVRSPTQFAFKHHPAPHTRNRGDYYEVCIPCHRALDRMSYVKRAAV